MKKSSAFTIAASLLIFTAAAALVKTDAAEKLDVNLAAAVQSLESGWLTALMAAVSDFGQWYVYAPIAILLLIIPKTRVPVGLPSAASLTVSAVANYVLKIIFAVPRPDVRRLAEASGFSFPSGHAMNGAAFAGALAICAIKYHKRPMKSRAKAALLVCAAAYVLAVGFSRVYLGVHNPSDVIAGYAAGAIICVIVISIAGKIHCGKNIKMI